MTPNLFYIDNEMWQFELVFITRLLLALLLGGLIGMERQRKKGKSNSAGFRTHILVTVGSCLFMLVSVSMPMVVSSMPSGIVNNADPGRIAAQVVSGIGFLGAGAILQGKSRVHGLTTAASLWVVAAIGLAVGAGLCLTATVATVMTFIILTWFSHLEDKAEAIMEKQAMIRRNRCLTEECEEIAKIEDVATETTQSPLLDKKELGKTEFL